MTLKNGRIRRTLERRRGKECEGCKARTFLQLHHKDQNVDNNEESNLLLLCRDCHRFIHKQIRKIHGKLETLGPPFYRRKA